MNVCPDRNSNLCCPNEFTSLSKQICRITGSVPFTSVPEFINTTLMNSACIRPFCLFVYNLDMCLCQEMSCWISTLKSIMTTYLKYVKCMKTEVNPFSVLWTRHWFPLMLNGVLENVLVCTHFSSKLANGTYSLCLVTHLIKFLGHWLNSIVYAQNELCFSPELIITA